MLRIAPGISAVLLLGLVLAGCSTPAPDIAKATGGDTADGHKKKEVADASKTAPTDLEGGIRQAQLMRSAGQYDDAIHTLSQLMLVASDDPRVVSEYGKTLAEKGRAQDAVEFLNRAIELSGNDWTLYSALGVSYDQLGNQTAAAAAYQHALMLHPEEPSVLNNFALSRMLAGDPQGAHQLIARAQAAGGASDAKIAANIALLNQVSPQAAQDVASARSVAPPKTAYNAPIPAPRAENAPRPLMPQQAMQAAANNGVVMQAVPFDPYAGPVKAKTSAVAAVTPKSDKTAKRADTKAVAVAAKQPGDAKTATPAAKSTDTKAAASAKTAAATKTDPKAAKVSAKDQVPSLRLAADARAP